MESGSECPSTRCPRLDDRPGVESFRIGSPDSRAIAYSGAGTASPALTKRRDDSRRSRGPEAVPGVVSPVAEAGS